MSGFSFGFGASIPQKTVSRDDILKKFTKMCVEVLHIMHLENIRIINRGFGVDFYEKENILELRGPYFLFDDGDDTKNVDFDNLKIALMNLEQAFHYPFRLVGFKSEPIVLKDMVDNYLNEIKEKSEMSSSFSYRMLHTVDEIRELFMNTNDPKPSWMVQSGEKLNIDKLKKLIFELVKPDHQKEDVDIKMSSDPSLMKVPVHRVLMKCRLFIRLIGLIGGLTGGTVSIKDGELKKELGTELDFDDIIFDTLVNDSMDRRGTFKYMRTELTGNEILVMNSKKLDELNESSKEKHAMAMGQIDEIFSFFDNLLKQEGEKMDEERSETTFFI